MVNCLLVIIVNTCYVQLYYYVYAQEATVIAKESFSSILPYADWFFAILPAFNCLIAN